MVSGKRKTSSSLTRHLLSSPRVSLVLRTPVRSHLQSKLSVQITTHGARHGTRPHGGLRASNMERKSGFERESPKSSELQHSSAARGIQKQMDKRTSKREVAWPGPGGPPGDRHSPSSHRNRWSSCQPRPTHSGTYLRPPSYCVRPQPLQGGTSEAGTSEGAMPRTAVCLLLSAAGMDNRQRTVPSLSVTTRHTMQ